MISPVKIVGFPGRLIFLVFIFPVILLSCGKPELTYVRTVDVAVDSLDQVRILTDSFVKPVIYTNLRGFEKLPTKKAKEIFISAVLPSILVARHNVENLELKLIHLQEKTEWSCEDSILFSEMKSRYRAINLEELIERIGIVPNSVVLAQAAVETGWGQSRFFTEANNIFGVWSWNEKDSRVAAQSTRGKDSVFVKSYPHLIASVSDYFELLGRGSSFEKFRQARNLKSDPLYLITHLQNYSEGRREYINLLRKIILKNDLTKYDHYRIHPDFLETGENQN